MVQIAFSSTKFPSERPGSINSIAIGAQDVAVIAGQYSGPDIFVFTLPITSAQFSSVQVSNPLSIGQINTVVIYDFDGLYDVRRMRPYYYRQINETIANE